MGAGRRLGGNFRGGSAIKEFVIFLGSCGRRGRDGYGPSIGNEGGWRKYELDCLLELAYAGEAIFGE